MTRTAIRLAVTLGVVAAIVVFLFPVVFPIRVDVPGKVQFATASSLTFLIANQNPTPVTDVAYSCEVTRFTLATGAAVSDANVLNRGNVRRIRGRSAVAGRCQTGYLITAPLSAAEYKLTIIYRAFPWPQLRTRMWRIRAAFNSKGELAGWKAE